MSALSRYTLFRVLLIVPSVLLLAGCYKSQYESEKTRADGLQRRAEDAEKQANQSRSELASTQARVQELESQLSSMRAGGALVAFIDGKPTVQDAIRWDGSRWVRHGDCIRAGGTVRFENGHLADQTLFINHPRGGKPWYTGAVKLGKPDGDWIWFDDNGRPNMRERWEAGRLVEVSKATTAKGPLTWTRLGEKDRAAWVRTSSLSLADLPELARDTAPTPATPAASAKPAGGEAKKPAR